MEYFRQNAQILSGGVALNCGNISNNLQPALHSTTRLAKIRTYKTNEISRLQEVHSYENVLQYPLAPHEAAQPALRTGHLCLADPVRLSCVERERRGAEEERCFGHRHACRRPAQSL